MATKCLISLKCLNLLNSIRQKISSLPLDIWHRKCSQRSSFWNNHKVNQMPSWSWIEVHIYCNISCNLSTRQGK